MPASGGRRGRGRAARLRHRRRLPGGRCGRRARRAGDQRRGPDRVAADRRAGTDAAAGRGDHRLPAGRRQPDLVATLRGREVLAFAMELVPRISRAQSMDALSSQALVGGYRAALVAAEKLPRFFPLFMTAAGTVPPAKVLVLGAGVAGLQAIATARRLGAVVEAYDVRPSSADEVRSMGATFLDLGLEVARGVGRLRARDGRGPRGPPAGAPDAVRRGQRCRHHHRRGARSRGAAAADDRDGRDDAAGLGRRRPGRGERRQLRAHGRRRRGRAPRRDGVGRAGRAVVDAGARQPALRPQRGQPAAADDPRRRGRAGLRRRDPGRLLRHPRRPA